MVETAGATDVHRVTATISTETAEAAAETANAEGPAPALDLDLDLAARPREEEADTTTITTAKEAQTAAGPIAETTTTLIAAAETPEAGETAAAAAATVARARPRRTTETLSTNHHHLRRRLAEDDEATAARPRHLRPKKKARKKANFRKERDQKPCNTNESAEDLFIRGVRNIFLVIVIVLLLLSSDSFEGRFLLFHEIFGRFLCHFFSLSSEFSFHWEKTDCFVTSFDLPLSLSLFHARYIYTRANTVRSAHLRKGEARFLSETEFVFKSC